MRTSLLTNERTLVGMFNRFASDKMILNYIELYTRKWANFRQNCPLLATFALSPFKECIIYFAFENLNGQYKFKIGQTNDWSQRKQMYKTLNIKIQLIFSFKTCLMVESVLLHYCSNSVINSEGTDCPVSEWYCELFLFFIKIYQYV
jgi:hypothetical protein